MFSDHAPRQSGSARRKPGTGFSDAITGDRDAPRHNYRSKNKHSVHLFPISNLSFQDDSSLCNLHLLFSIMRFYKI